MSQSATLLHISDMQFGKNHRFGRLGQNAPADLKFDTLFTRLTDDLKLLERDKDLKPNGLIVSGDLVELGTKSEFTDALEFLESLVLCLGITKEHTIFVPGNHDVNRKLCEGYFNTCEGNDTTPTQPYWPKFKHYTDLLKAFYGTEKPFGFSENRPYYIQELKGLNVVFGAFNSCMAESHLPEHHYGAIGEEQARWFAAELSDYRARGWLRLGVVHHNIQRGATSDDENLRDAPLLDRYLGNMLNVLFHGHTHEGKVGWLNRDVPILSTGSAALLPVSIPEEVGNQYQIVKISPDRIERWLRRYDPSSPKWVGDTRASSQGDDWYSLQKVELANVHALSDTVSHPSPPLVAEPLVQVNSPISPESARRILSVLPRLHLSPETHHRSVRVDEQRRFITALRERKSCWLISDWGYGKDGFMACAFERLGGDLMLSNVFQLQCGGVSNCEELLSVAETQLGLSFQEFSVAIAATPAAVLVFDDLPEIISTGSERAAFEFKVRPLFDFSPSLHLIFASRHEPRNTPAHEVVVLGPLDITEVKNYLHHHTRLHQSIDGPDELERVHAWSGGLPMHLDRYVDRLPFLLSSEILEDDAPIPADGGNEPLPESLKIVVDALSKTTDRNSRKSYRLLKVLTVLRDGETFHSIRRFYREPFHQSHIDELISVRLIEEVPITQTAIELSVRKQNIDFRSEVPKLLRVPKQVRDYIDGIIQSDERNDIISTSMGLFFGQDWWKGKIRLRTTISSAYQQSAIIGPGNEHIVARHLLKRALEKSNGPQITRYIQVSLMYCHKLIAADRFRDAVTAAEAVVSALSGTQYVKEWVEASHIYGRALRMVGRFKEAVTVLRECTSAAPSDLMSDFMAELNLALSMAYKSIGNESLAVETANLVLAQAHKESSEAYQAQALLAELTLAGERRESRLIELEESARNHKRSAAADNIALDLAGYARQPEDALRWLRKVLLSAKDTYNRSRAIIEKATVLGANLKASELSDDDLSLLSAAYSYSFAQRMGNLMDRCHKVLWNMYKREGVLAPLVRLFRFSSFVWRLRGSEDTEAGYLNDVGQNLDLARLKAQEGQTLQIEILYLERRLQSRETLELQSASTVNTGVIPIAGV